MREIAYVRHDFHHPDEARHAPLPVFLLDVPYALAFGVIPPPHLLNQLLASGGGDAGMSPGTSWVPFSLDEAEYADLVRALLGLDLRGVGDAARFVPDAIREDRTLWSAKSNGRWLRAVRDRHAPDH